MPKNFPGSGGGGEVVAPTFLPKKKRRRRKKVVEDSSSQKKHPKQKVEQWGSWLERVGLIWKSWKRWMGGMVMGHFREPCVCVCGGGVMDMGIHAYDTFVHAWGIWLHGHTYKRQVLTCIRVCGWKGIHAYDKYVHAWGLSMGLGGGGWLNQHILNQMHGCNVS